MAQSSSITRATFAKLSPHDFLLANLQPTDPAIKSCRTNGRAQNEARRPKINAGSLSHAHGSAIVRNGDTTVICGVRGEILPVANIPHFRSKSGLELADPSQAEKEGRKELRDYDLLVPNIELATGSAPQFLPGVPPTALAQTLSTRVYSLLHSCALLDVEELRIWYTKSKGAASADGGDRMEEDGEEQNVGEGPEIKAYWTLYIDLLFISFDGNPFDVAWAAVIAALRNTKLPRAWWDADREMVVCSSVDRRGLTVRGLPMPCSAAVLQEREYGEGGKHWALLDPDRLEESLCDEVITMVVDRSQGETRIRGISKSGGMVMGAKFMQQFTTMAEKRWHDFQRAIEQKSDIDMTLS